MNELLSGQVIIVLSHGKQSILTNHTYVTIDDSDSIREDYERLVLQIIIDARENALLIMPINDDKYNNVKSLEEFNSKLAYDYCILLIEEYEDYIKTLTDNILKI